MLCIGVYELNLNSVVAVGSDFDNFYKLFDNSPRCCRSVDTGLLEDEMRVYDNGMGRD